LAKLKILIIGGSGTIGSKIIEQFQSSNIIFDYTFLTNPIPSKIGYMLDITNRKNTIELITKLNPDIVIHTAALTNVDLCETNNALANLINVQGTKNIVDGCMKIKSKIIFISTSYVFDGNSDQYFEEDLPNPTSYYGITKYKSEKIIQNSNLDFLILRTDQPYCWIEKWQKMNSVIRLIQTLKKGATLKEIVDWYNNPTYVPDFALALNSLLQKNYDGIYHLTGSDFINRYEWSLKVSKIFNLKSELIIPINSKNLNLPVTRKKIKLNNEKIFQKTGHHMINVDDGLKKMFNLTKN
jgi:dTDP-4-dehydrorhamnose reductase